LIPGTGLGEFGNWLKVRLTPGEGSRFTVDSIRPEIRGYYNQIDIALGTSRTLSDYRQFMAFSGRLSQIPSVPLLNKYGLTNGADFMGGFLGSFADGIWNLRSLADEWYIRSILGFIWLCLCGWYGIRYLISTVSNFVSVFGGGSNAKG